MARTARLLIQDLRARSTRSLRAGTVRAAVCAAALIFAVVTPLVASIPSIDDAADTAYAAMVPISPAHASAERAYITLPDDTLTLWNGVASGPGERARAPDWALDRRSPAGAMATAAIEATPPAPPIYYLGAPPSEPLVVMRPEPSAPSDVVNVAALSALPPLPETEAPYEPAPYETAQSNINPTVAAAFASAQSSSGAPAGPPRFAPTPNQRPDVGTIVPVAPRNAPRITIVLTAVGVNEDASRRALERLPNEIAFAVAPIAQNGADWVAAAREDGRVVLAEIPMDPESVRARDPGPLTLRVDDSAEANLARLDEALSLLPNVDGVATFLGGRFTADADALRPILSDLRARSLFIVETKPGALSQLHAIGDEVGLPTAASVVSLDMSGRTSDITEGLALLEEEARRSGRAIGIAVAMPSSVRALEDWVARARARGVQITPLRL